MLLSHVTHTLYSGQGIGHNIVLSLNVLYVQIVFLQSQTPPHKPLIFVLHLVDEGEGVMICKDKHRVHCGTQIHIKMPQCQNKSKALLLNCGVISLVLVKLLGEVRNRMIYSVFTILHENSTTPYVTGIYGQFELFLKVWCNQNWFTNQYGFDFVETIFSFI